jgi:hypothetical protein
MDDIELPRLSNVATDAMYTADARLAMARIDEWLADARKTLIGRDIVLTREPHKGRVHTITKLIIRPGGSGYHMNVGSDKSGPRFELGVNCELLAIDDTPTEDKLDG